MKCFAFRYRDKPYFVVVEQRCPLCGALAVVALPPAIKAEQPDATTHVCHPLAGGCNHGFELQEASQ